MPHSSKDVSSVLFFYLWSFLKKSYICRHSMGKVVYITSAWPYYVTNCRPSRPINADKLLKSLAVLTLLTDGPADQFAIHWVTRALLGGKSRTSASDSLILHRGFCVVNATHNLDVTGIVTQDILGEFKKYGMNYYIVHKIMNNDHTIRK